MRTYVVVRYTVRDPDAYSEYRRLAGPTHVPYGGSLVAKGTETEQLEGGDNLDNFVLLEFPDAPAARAWFLSAEYQAARAVRDEAGTMTLTIVEG